MLSGQGFRVVHSTRHTALEFGKDILAISPEGIGCAYQLKGNPGGRLGLSQFRSEIQPQLVQLMSQSVVYAGFPTGPHSALLVSNGYFDEEVQRAIDDLNRGPYPSKVSLISRGELLEWCKAMGVALWPSELKDSRLLLEVVLSPPRDILPTEKLFNLLEKILRMDPEDESAVPQSEFRRMATSASLLVGIATAHFAESKNYYAVAAAWALLAVMIVGAAEKHGHELSGTTASSFELAQAASLDALAELWLEIEGRTHLVEGSAMTDPEVYGWRIGVLRGALSCFAMAHYANPIISEEQAAKLREWLISPQTQFVHVWGEGAVVNLIPWLIFMRSADATIRPDLEIAALADAVISRNQHDSASALPNPYYSFEEIVTAGMPIRTNRFHSSIERETFSGASYTAVALIHLLVRTNLKKKCKELWADFTRIGHRHLSHNSPWHYCLFNVRPGLDVTRLYPLTYEWAELKREALSIARPAIPEMLLSRPWLLAFWWQVAPHRLNSDACRFVAESLNPNWGN